MKTVMIYKWERLGDDTFHSKVEQGEAKFHEWGVDYEEFEEGPGNFSAAIIELNDGSVELVHASLIKFID